MVLQVEWVYIRWSSNQWGNPYGMESRIMVAIMGSTIDSRGNNVAYHSGRRGSNNIVNRNKPTS